MEREDPGKVVMVWSSEADRRLLKAVDEYVGEYGKIYEHDWQIIATSVNQNPKQLDEMRARYILFNSLGIKSYDDYSEYQLAKHKNAWLYANTTFIMTSRYSRNLQLARFRSSLTAADSLLESDLLLLNHYAVTKWTLFDKRVWEYLGGQQRIGYMRYLDVTDKVIDRMPKGRDEKQFFVDPNEAIVSTLCNFKRRFGATFDRTRGIPVKPVLLNPVSGINKRICEAKPEEIEQFTRPHSIDPNVIKAMIQKKSNNLLSFEEWSSIFCVRPNGYQTFPHDPIWFVSCVLRNRGIMHINLQHTTNQEVQTSKDPTEMTLEFYAYVLPNYWLFSSTMLMVHGSALPRHVPVQVLTVNGCVAIYHTLTVVSLKHIRKTILYLVLCGAFKVDEVTPTEWLKYFVMSVINLPCGECWKANPIEFETVRRILRKEAYGLEMPTKRSFPSREPDRYSACRLGDGCWWNRTTQQ